MNAITQVEREPLPAPSEADLAQRLRAEATGLVQDLKSRGVSEQDAAFTWTSGIAASFVHLGGLLEHVRTELGGIVDAQTESRATFRKDVIDAARSQFDAIDAEIKKMRLARQLLEAELDKKIGETVRSLGEQIATANKSANVIFQKRWNFRQNMTAAVMSGALLLGCVIGGYLWRSAQEGNAVSGRYACERAPLLYNSATGPALACPMQDLVGAGVLAALDHRFIKSSTPAQRKPR